MQESITVSGNRQSRLVYLDLLKTLALCFMLLYHCTLYPLRLGPEAAALDLFRMFLRTILSTCVPLFFFVNGYLLLRQKLDLKKHTIRLAKTVLVTSFWMLFLLLVMQPVHGQYFTWEETFERFWSLQQNWNNHLWFMGTLVQIYILFPAVKQSYDSNQKVFCYLTGVCLLLTFGNPLINEFLTVFNRVVRNETIVYDRFEFFHMFDPLSGMLGIGLSYFCLGGVMLSLQEKIESVSLRKRNLLAGLGILLSCCLLLALGFGYSLLKKELWDVVWNGYDTVFTLCNVVCLFVLSLNWKKDFWLVRLISENTLGVYCMHVIFQVLLAQWFVYEWKLNTFLGSCLYGAALLAVCLAVCWVVKKIPILRNLI